MRPHAGFYALLLVFGAGWGGMQPLNKIAVSTGFQPWGIMAWQGIVTICLAGAICAWRGRMLPKTGAGWAVAAQIAVLGTLVPHWATYTAVNALPAGLMAILLATIPIIALPLGLVTGREALTARRAIGVSLGMGAVILIVALRGSVGTGAGWAIATALVAPFCYALNSSLLVSRGMAGLEPVQAFFASALIFMPAALAVSLLTGQAIVPFGPGEAAASAALFTIAALHTLIYVTFLWVVTRTGAVFASQSAYLVTGFGVLWSWALLGERYPPAILLAGGMMILGMILVRPVQAGPR